METYNEDFTPKLQELLSLLNDGTQGYQKAAKETGNPDLKNLFLQFSSSREKLATEMRRRLIACGGNPQNTSAGILVKFHRHWMNLKTALSANNDQMILETCRNGDLALMDAYDDILQGAILETSLKPFLMNQRIDVHQEYLEIERRYYGLFKTNSLV